MSKKPGALSDPLMTRRSAMSGIALGGAGLLTTGLTSGPALASTEWTLDLDTAEDNCIALLKMQADISGAQTMGGFPGEVWAWVPNEGSVHVLNTYGVGVSRVEFHPEENGWRFYHREALVYVDPITGDVVDSWYNPFTQRTVEVLHIFNEHVNRFYPLDGGRFAFPWPYEVHGNNLVFRISVFRLEDNPMSRKEYPLHSQSDKYQTGELWGMIGDLREVMDPAVTSASCVTSWSRVSEWLPFMEMGNRPGQMIYHSHAYKLNEGPQELPAQIRTWFEKNAPEYFETPTEWTPPGERVTAWTYTKQLVDERRAKGLKEGETPFSWPKS
jgi:hypothetical protein